MKERSREPDDDRHSDIPNPRLSVDSGRQIWDDARR